MIAQSKPPFVIPTMADVAAVPRNGYNVVSTFSGCGGSSLGYKLAGFRVKWANEFIPAAAEVYALNHPDTILDTRDVRHVTGAEILDAIGMSRGELDVLDGSPPCASFSTAGRGKHHWGDAKQYSDTVQRVDDLFFEYVRLVGEVQPKTFIAENVSGLIKGVAQGYFKNILSAFEHLDYDIEVRLLNAQWLGVPQMRERLIFMGVRRDLDVKPRLPKPLPYFYPIADVLPYVLNVKYGSYPHNWKDGTHIAPTIMQSDHGVTETAYFSGGGFIRVADEKRPGKKTTRKMTIDELKRICTFPDDFVLTGTFEQQWERLGRAVPPTLMMHVASCVRDALDESQGRDRGEQSQGRDRGGNLHANTRQELISHAHTQEDRHESAAAHE